MLFDLTPAALARAAQVNPGNTSASSYSALNRLEGFREPGGPGTGPGPLALRLVWPELGPAAANVWRQRSNPALDPPGTAAAAGFEPVALAFPAGFRGLRAAVAAEAAAMSGAAPGGGGGGSSSAFLVGADPAALAGIAPAGAGRPVTVVELYAAYPDSAAVLSTSTMPESGNTLGGAAGGTAAFSLRPAQSGALAPPAPPAFLVRDVTTTFSEAAATETITIALRPGDPGPGTGGRVTITGLTGTLLSDASALLVVGAVGNAPIPYDSLMTFRAAGGRLSFLIPSGALLAASPLSNLTFTLASLVSPQPAAAVTLAASPPPGATVPPPLGPVPVLPRSVFEGPLRWAACSSGTPAPPQLGFWRYCDAGVGGVGCSTNCRPELGFACRIPPAAAIVNLSDPFPRLAARAAALGLPGAAAWLSGLTASTAAAGNRSWTGLAIAAVSAMVSGDGNRPNVKRAILQGIPYTSVCARNGTMLDGVLDGRIGREEAAAAVYTASRKAARNRSRGQGRWHPAALCHTRAPLSAHH